MCDFGVFLTASVVGLTMLKVTIIHMPKTDTGDHDSVLCTVMCCFHKIDNNHTCIVMFHSAV